MAPPVNIDATLATDLGSTFPFDVTQRVDDAGITYTVWYKFTAPGGSEYISIWASGAQNGVGYTPNPDIWLGPDTAPVQYLPPMGGNDCPIFFIVSPGTTYWIRVFHFGNTVPSNLRIRGAVFVQQTVPIGSILIPDDSENQNSAALSSTVSFGVLKFFPQILACAFGDFNPSGQLLTDDLTGSAEGFNLYPNTSFASHTHIPHTFPGTSFFPPIRWCHGQGCWYIFAPTFAPAPFGQILKITTAGVKSTIAADIGLYGGDSIAATNDGTKIYLGGTGGGSHLSQPTKTWSVGGGAFIADFTASLGANYFQADMLVLPNDKVIICWQKGIAPRDITIIIYNAAGAVLNTIAYGALTDTFPHACLEYDWQDLNGKFWMRTFNPSATNPQRSQIVQFNVVAGTENHRVEQVTYDLGVYGGGDVTAAPESLYGTPGTCPLLVMPLAATDYSGLYIMVDDKTQDTLYDAGDVKIPNPLFQTYLSSDGG